MKLGHLKNYIAYTFIVAYLSLRVASFHVFTHEGNNAVDCDVCEFVITTNFTPQINTPTEVVLVNNIEFYTLEIEEEYDFISKKSLKKEALFTRPPPMFS